jgi:thiazole/oxazole-forming peptide maturase SagD family component
VELEGLDPERLRALWQSLRTPRSSGELDSLLAPFGDAAADLRTLFVTEAVIRPCPARAPSTASPSGEGPLLPILSDLLRTGWAVPKLHCATLGEIPRGMGAEGAAVAVAPLGDGVVWGGLGCASCWALRTLAVRGEPGAEQTPSPPSSTIDRERLLALVATSLLELEQRPLSAWEGYWVRLERGESRGRFLPHPDCPACTEGRAGKPDPDELRRDLNIEPAPPVEAEAIRAIFGDSPFAPLELHEHTRPAGDLPFDLPYLSGDLRFNRHAGGKTLCTTMPGIFHGSAVSEARSRMLAWSEGVERLAAHGAWFDLAALPDDPQVQEMCARYGFRSVEREGEPVTWCRGLDLIRDSECLVPFGRVAVGLPPSFRARGFASQPTFTGTASHVTSLEAVLHATVEVLKRDAFMIAWYRKRRLSRVSLPSELPRDIALRLDYLRRHGLTFELFDLRSDLPLPMLLADVRAGARVGNWPAGGAVLIPAAGFTPLDALRQACTLASARFVGLGLDDSPERDPLNPAAVAKLAQTAAFWPSLARYLDPAHAGRISCLAGSETVSLASIACQVGTSNRDRFEALRGWLACARLSWLAVPLGDRAVRVTGLRVVKVIVPEAVPLVLDAVDVDGAQPRLRAPWPGAEPGSWNEFPHPVY